MASWTHILLLLFLCAFAPTLHSEENSDSHNSGDAQSDAEKKEKEKAEFMRRALEAARNGDVSDFLSQAAMVLSPDEMKALTSVLDGKNDSEIPPELKDKIPKDFLDQANRLGALIKNEQLVDNRNRPGGKDMPGKDKPGASGSSGGTASGGTGKPGGESPGTSVPEVSAYGDKTQSTKPSDSEPAMIAKTPTNNPTFNSQKPVETVSTDRNNSSLNANSSSLEKANGSASVRGGSGGSSAFANTPIVGPPTRAIPPAGSLTDSSSFFGQGNAQSQSLAPNPGSSSNTPKSNLEVANNTRTSQENSNRASNLAGPSSQETPPAPEISRVENKVSAGNPHPTGPSSGNSPTEAGFGMVFQTASNDPLPMQIPLPGVESSRGLASSPLESQNTPSAKPSSSAKEEGAPSVVTEPRKIAEIVDLPPVPMKSEVREKPPSLETGTQAYGLTKPEKVTEEVTPLPRPLPSLAELGASPSQPEKLKKEESIGEATGDIGKFLQFAKNEIEKKTPQTPVSVTAEESLPKILTVAEVEASQKGQVPEATAEKSLFGNRPLNLLSGSEGKTGAEIRAEEAQKKNPKPNRKIEFGAKKKKLAMY